ncbi:toll/interleukin-1 receptor domain-containing protein [Pseudofrankia sp. BMG5.37]|uniref:toll/interleukin-1 receptor domain-containing protein n=1 Tax=Pseudofrankia sp. BMG5.37 TaxID=3050035 RepID=UPI0028948957|nr:toll/interleukin-1 receptor domain-containing protein [Pseudofrankia sp. BMG5.37]MDT3443596.1 toll/interleukin-1 receptor domain-containing protein [Pseudofrankia sp. BMG5.37]
MAGPTIFISYAEVDRAWADWVAWQISDKGYPPLLKAWHAVPGANLTRWLHEAVSQAGFTLLLLTEEYLVDTNATLEWQAGFDDEGRLLPVRVKPCATNGLLGNLVTIDLVGLDESTARRTLLEGLRSAGTGLAKPTGSPSFPGAPSDPPAFPAGRDTQPLPDARPAAVAPSTNGHFNTLISGRSRVGTIANIDSIQGNVTF